MICPHCGNEVRGEWRDYGIGSYEYWGCKGVDKQMVFECEECDEELEAPEPDFDPPDPDQYDLDLDYDYGP